MIKADIAARERTIDEISCLGLDINLRDLVRRVQMRT